MECRLTRTSRDPFERVEPGERIYFKQSAGPFAASATVEHALFESNLTPRRVGEIKRDYNHLIKGADEYWRLKRNSAYCTLIWLKDVQAVTSGPAIRPLQGVAWLCLDDEPAWRRVENKGVRPLFGESFAIEITAGNLRNNTLYATNVIEHFPDRAIGGASKADAGEPLTLMLHEGPTVQTDIVSGRNLLRTRVWGKWFRAHGAKPGDRVIFTPVDEATYFVGLARGV